LNIIEFTARATIWKATRQPPPAGLLAVTVCSLLAFGSNLVDQYVGAGAEVRFSPYGLNSDLATILVTIAVSAAFVRAQWRATVLASLMLMSCLEYLAGAAIELGRQGAALHLAEPSFWTNDKTQILIFLVYLLWWLGAIAAIFRSVQPERFRAVPRAFVCWIALLISLLALPSYPTFRGADFDVRTSSLWQYIPAYLNSRLSRPAAQVSSIDDGAEVDFSQPALLEAQFSALSPRTKGKANIYAIGIAGSVEQDVFLSELKGGLDVLSRLFSLNGHIVELVNQPDTIRSFPVASRQNLAAAMRAVVRVMDTEEDILLLFVTSHGSPEGIALSLPGNVYSGLTPTDLATLLDQEGIKNRIVIVSACYSGVFIKPLANDHTVIIAAADENSTSFGCANKREWTYFGDAFFHRALRGSATLEEAFLDAKTTIAQWEARDGLTPSNPQGQFGAALMEKLKPLYRNSKNAMVSPSH
jgi:hypothetical protein